MNNPTNHINGKEENPLVPMAFYDAVTVGERGQIVIPQAARETLDIKPGSKLLVMGGKIPLAQGLFIIKADAVGNLLNSAIANLSGMRDFLKRSGGKQ